MSWEGSLHRWMVKFGVSGSKTTFKTSCTSWSCSLLHTAGNTTERLPCVELWGVSEGESTRFQPFPPIAVGSTSKSCNVNGASFNNLRMRWSSSMMGSTQDSDCSMAFSLRIKVWTITVFNAFFACMSQQWIFLNVVCQWHCTSLLFIHWLLFRCASTQNFETWLQNSGCQQNNLPLRDEMRSDKCTHLNLETAHALSKATSPNKDTLPLQHLILGSHCNAYSKNKRVPLFLAQHCATCAQKKIANSKFSSHKSSIP